MATVSKEVRERPMSPHVSIWRWHVTMAGSILHRMTGMALYVGALIAAAWAVCLGAGPDAYAGFKAVMGSPLGLFVMFGLSLSFFYHLAAGVRHLIWDLGYGLQVRTASAFAVGSFAFAIAATLAIWAIAAMTGAL